MTVWKPAYGGGGYSREMSMACLCSAPQVKVHLEGAKSCGSTTCYMYAVTPN